MKNKSRVLSGFICLFMLLTTLFTLSIPMISYASDGVVYINSADDLIAFAKNCSYDNWSVGKNVVLTTDISLEGTSFEPIPSFSGCFDGDGHTISGLNINNSYSPCGLFASLEKDGVIKNLTVSGNITPDGDKTYVGGIVGDNNGTIENCSFIGTIIGSSDVGGIAGINRVSGSVIDCTTNGMVVGESRTGGIVGSNSGIASSCESKSAVNTIAITPSLSLDNLSISTTIDITKLPSLTDLSTSDIGGIAGYSTGIIIGCKNNGDVGYPHIGYNVGGIVGRNCGHLNSNVNNGTINGRKDVGGIIGQMEPYVSYNMSDDLLGSLRSDLNELSLIINGTLGEIGDSIPAISSKFDTLLDNITGATNAVNKISDQISDYGTDVIDEINRFSIILSKTTSLIKDITDDLPELALIIADGLDEMNASITALNNAADITTDALEEVVDVLSDAYAEISNQLTTLSDSIAKIQEGAELLVNADGTSIEDIEHALALVLEGMEGVTKVVDGLDNYLPRLEEALSSLKSAGGEASVSATHLAKALSKFAEASRILSGSISDLNSLLTYLEKVDPIQLPTLPESIQSTVGELFMFVLNVESGIKDLNSSITSLSGNIVSNAAKINETFNKISNTVIDGMYGLNDNSIIDKDVSEDEIGEITNGKIFSCINNGNVSGDINVGGISGAMGIEYSADPEDDTTLGDTSLLQNRYELKTVIHACKSYGKITSKYDAVGGICGNMSLGLIYDCEAYCTVQSQSGNYVGGIAGISAGSISSSCAKCLLSGKKYVGGIIGSGVANDTLSSTSIVKNCYSMVKIASFAQYAGAISGANIGKYENNLFVSDTLSGLDRVSYKGKAEPISYEDLIKRRVVPDGFYTFTLEFVANGNVLYSTEFKYGESFDSSIFPNIPTIEGYYGYWDRSDLTNLVFDTMVSVVYKAYTWALGSEEKRDDGREIFFACGEFTDADKLTLAANCNTSDLLLVDKLFTKDSLQESWVLTIPKDNLDVNTIHFLASINNCKIYVKQGNEWNQVDTSKFGSYLVFDASSEILEIAVVKHTVNLLPVVILSLLVIAAFTVVIIVLIKKKKAQATASKEELKGKIKA